MASSLIDANWPSVSPPKATWAEKITAVATLLAHNTTHYPRDRRHYEVFTSLLKEHPLNAVAPLLAWEPGEGTYAISFTRWSDSTTIYVAGDNDVSEAKCAFLKELWSKLYLLRNLRKPKKKKRTEGNTLDEQIPDLAYEIWSLVIEKTYPKLRKRIQKHLPYLQFFQHYICSATIRDDYARAFVTKYIGILEVLDEYLTRLEKIESPQETAKIFANNRKFIAMFMLTIAQFKNQMSWVWQTIDEIARYQKIGCKNFGKRAHRDYSRHFLKISEVFMLTHELLESTRAPTRGGLWDLKVEVEVIDRRSALPNQPSDPDAFKALLRQIFDEAFEGAEEEDIPILKQVDFNVGNPTKVVPPELQLIHAFLEDPPMDLTPHIATSKSTSYPTEAVFHGPIPGQYEFTITPGVGRIYKGWSMPEGVLQDVAAKDVYWSLCCDLTVVAEDKLEMDEDGLTKSEREEEERLRRRERRLMAYRAELTCGLEKMVRHLHNMPVRGQDQNTPSVKREETATPVLKERPSWI